MDIGLFIGMIKAGHEQVRVETWQRMLPLMVLAQKIIPLEEFGKTGETPKSISDAEIVAHAERIKSGCKGRR